MEKIKTIKENVNAVIEEKRSTFIADIYYVDSINSAEAIIKEVRKKYYDAKHHCFAYIINEENQVKRFSDDGEPTGTAGSPILNVIEKNGLCDVLIVVTRYFGGILLGTGGLVRAYTEAATRVVEKAEYIYQEKGYEIEIVIEYQDLEKLKYYCNKNNIKIEKIDYKENIRCILEVTNEEKENILGDNVYNNKLANIIEFNILGEKYIRK